jgi:UDP-glucuronate 4-epimerase
MSVLVTGGAGFIGSHLCERLLEDAIEVVSLDSYDDFYDPGIKRGNLSVCRDHARFTEVEGDIRDAGRLEKLPEIDTIIHLAARAGVRPSIEAPVLYHEVNVGGTLSLLEFARRRSIDRFVFGSSSSVYGNNEKVPFSEDDPVDHPISPYAATKKAGELLCHTYHHLNDLGVLCLRFFTVYGPRQRPDLAIHKFTRLMTAGEPVPRFGDGSTERDYTYVDDIVDGVMGVLEYLEAHPAAYEIINLGENRTVSLSEMIDTVSRALAVKPTIEEMPLQPGDVTRTYADVSKARALLSYAPRTSFQEGVRRFVEWFRGQASGSG